MSNRKPFVINSYKGDKGTIDKRSDAEKLEAGRKRREIEEKLEDKALEKLISDELEGL